MWFFFPFLIHYSTQQLSIIHASFTNAPLSKCGDLYSLLSILNWQMKAVFSVLLFPVITTNVSEFFMIPLW